MRTLGHRELLDRNDRRYDEEIEFTTACQDAPGILSSDFGQPRAVTHGRPASVLYPREDGGTTICDTQADVPSARRLRAQLAFKDSMVHGILQFTPSIAFRYVLHRCESRDIRCRESCGLNSFAARGGQQASRVPKLGTVFLDAFGAVGSFTPSPHSEERRLSRIWLSDDGAATQ